jgi:putative addiction module killer protein
MFDVQSYLTAEGVEPYAVWLASLPDRQARARVAVRIGRMSSGNLGDVKPVGQGVWEALIDWGPGYRVYWPRSTGRLAA